MSVMQNATLVAPTSEYRFLRGDDGARVRIPFASSIQEASPCCRRKRTMPINSSGHEAIILVVAEINLMTVADGSISSEA